MQSGSNAISPVLGLGSDVVSTAGFTFRTLWQLSFFILLTLFVSFVFMLFLPHQATLIADGEYGLRRVYYFYADFVYPILARISVITNPLICWWNTFVYMTNFFLRNVLYDLLIFCNLETLLTPTVSLLDAFARELLVAQLLNYNYIFSQPLNITSLIQPMKDIGATAEDILCCGCNDLCFLFQWILSPLQDDYLYCAIQGALDMIFYVFRPVLEYLLVLLYGGTVPRPKFQKLTAAFCQTVFCLFTAAANFVQYLVSDIIGISVNVVGIACPFVTFFCIISRAAGMMLEFVFNFDQVIGFPGNPYLNSEARPQLRLLLNMIAKPTEVVRIEDYYVQYATDSIGNPVPYSYDYSTNVLPGFLPLPYTVQDCACLVTQIVTANITSAQFDVCVLYNVATPLVDLVFFLTDMFVNIWRFRQWAPRMDFAFLEGILLPGGVLEIIPEIWRPLGSQFSDVFMFTLAIVAEPVRWLTEVLRIPLVGKDAFGFFLPDSMFSGPRVRCSRFPISLVPEAADSCNLLESASVFWHALWAKWADSICGIEAQVTSDLQLGTNVKVFCEVSGAFAGLISSAARLLVGIIYGIGFGDPDNYLAGPSESLQEDLEVVTANFVKIPGSACNLLKAVFIYFGLPGSSEPCSCFNNAAQGLASNAIRLIASILVNLGRDFNMNQPYFQAGQQQSPGIDRTFLSGYDALGRATGIGPKGDVERVVEALVNTVFCALALTELLPSLAAAVDVVRSFFRGAISAITRLAFATLLSILQVDFDYFLDYTQGVRRDTYWAKTSRFFALTASVVDLIQSPIVWNNFGSAPDIATVNTVTPNEYPANLNGSLADFVSPDIFSPAYENGFASEIPTLFQATRFLLAFFLTDSIASKLICPFARAVRVIISIYLLVFEFILRVMSSFQSVGAIKPLVIDWIFGCNVLPVARSAGYQSLRFNSLGGTTLLSIASSCADTDGMLVAFVMTFKCPCDWLRRLTAGPLICLCGSNSFQANIQGSAGAGIIGSPAELFSTVVGVLINLLRHGLTFDGSYSISTELIAPIMISVTRYVFASTCILVSLFGDECSNYYWWKFLTSAVRIMFSIPFFVASILDRLMQKIIGVSANEYHGGQPNFSNTGYNKYSFNSNDPAQCDPNLNKLACGRPKSVNQPKKADPGEEGFFTIIAQLIFPMSQIFIDALEFLNCAISESLKKVSGGAAKVVNATLGGLIEIAKMIQSVFFSILHFAWQMFEMVMYFLTGHVGWGNLIGLAKIGVRLFTTIVQALGGHPADAHTYYNGKMDVESAINKCLADDVYQGYNLQIVAAQNMVPPDHVSYAQNVAARDAWYAQCIGEKIGYNVDPAVLQFVNPSLDTRRRTAPDMLQERSNIDSKRETRRRRAVVAERLGLHRSPVAPVSFDREMWTQWAGLMASTDNGLYSDDVESSMASMASRFDQDMCRHDNIAYCICPWEPEIASGTTLCEPGRKLSADDERDLLQRSMLFSFTGTTQCDALVEYMAMDKNWEESSFMERSTLADCLNKRADSVHLAKEMCSGVEVGDLCTWPKNLMYQPDKNAAFMAAVRAHDMWTLLRKARNPTPEDKHRAHKARAAERLFNDTQIPQETWSNWIPKEPSEQAKRNARVAALQRKVSTHAARHRRHVIDRQQANTPPEGFLLAVARNLTRREYDQETSEWLRGERDMPLDLLLRTHGPTLFAEVITIGSPCLLTDPDAAWNDSNWRKGEFDGDPDKAHRLRTGPKEDLDAHVFEHYNPRTLSGYRFPSSEHRRQLRYELKGWSKYSGHVHRNTRDVPRRRSPEENLATFEERRDTRLRRITHLARKVGAVGPIARDVHGIPPTLQQLHLDGMKAVDYLAYGYVSGAFYDAIMSYNALDDAGANPDKPTLVSFAGGIASRFSDGWEYINDLLESHDGYAPNTLHLVAWNATVSAIETSRAYWNDIGNNDPSKTANGKEEDFSGDGPHSRARSRGRQEVEDEKEEEKEEYQYEDDDYEYEADPNEVTLMTILSEHWNPPALNLSGASPEFSNWWDAWGTLKKAQGRRYASSPHTHVVKHSNADLRSRVQMRSREVYLAQGAILQKHMGYNTADADTMLCDLQRRYSTELAPTCGSHSINHRSARFLFSGNCEVISKLISEFVRVMSYCPGRFSPPTLPPSVRRVESTEMTLWHAEAISRNSLRQENPGASVDYGSIFTDLERLAKLFDYLVRHIPLFNLLNVSGRLRAIVSGTNDFWTNPNLDESAGPVGFAFWLRILRRCDAFISVDCARGVGALQAAKDLLLWFGVAYLLVAIFLPWSIGVPIMLLMGPVMWAFFGIHAWRYSPMCWTKFMIPECIWAEVDALITFVFRPCYSGFPTCLTTNGVVCVGRDEYLSIVDCRQIGINSGFSVIAGATRLISRTACGKVAGFLESFVFMGPHGFAPQVTRFVRDTCHNTEFAGDQLACQQNACLVIMAPTVLPWLVYGLLAVMLVIIVVMLLKAIFRCGSSYVRVGDKAVRFKRPEKVPGTGQIAEPLRRGDD